jgi:hypothetical protein
MTTLLLPDSTLVECQLLTLQDVSISTTALARPGRDDSIETTSLKLLLQRRLNFASLLTLSMLLLHALALLLISRCISLGLSPPAQVRSVVCLVPLSEWRSVDLDNGALGQGVGSDEFVVGGMEGDTDDTGLAGDGFGAPCEVAGVETECTEFAVTATGADEMDALGTDTGVRWLTTLLESSVAMLLDMVLETIGLCIPLLAVVCPLSTSS